jgi:hypothetical protein
VLGTEPELWCPELAERVLQGAKDKPQAQLRCIVRFGQLYSSRVPRARAFNKQAHAARGSPASHDYLGPPKVLQWSEFASLKYGFDVKTQYAAEPLNDTQVGLLSDMFIQCC